LDVLAIIDQIKKTKSKETKKLKPDEPLKEYSGMTPGQLKGMLTTMYKARRVEREEKLLLRKGYNRFFIGCGGKELIDVCFAESLRDNDPWVGYYRNKAFDLHRGSTLEWKMLEAIGDIRSPGKGQQIPAHPGYPDLAVLPQSSSTGAHALEAAGLSEAIMHPVPISKQSHHPGGAYPEDAVTVCSIGEGSTSEAEFARAVFYASFYKTKSIFAIYNCGWCR